MINFKSFLRLLTELPHLKLDNGDSVDLEFEMFLGKKKKAFLDYFQAFIKKHNKPGLCQSILNDDSI